MKTLSVGHLIAYAICIAVSALLGLSLTRTTSLRDEDKVLYAAGGAVVGAVCVLILHAIKDRVVLYLPPPRQLRGLKVFLAGFAVAIAGWLIASFIAFEAGINIAFVGVLVCFLGSAVHFASRGGRK